MPEASIFTNHSNQNEVQKDLSMPSLQRLNNGRPITIAVGSGKGGVGKTCFSLLLAIFLARHKYKVVLVDTDFTGPDLHRLLSLSNSEVFLQSFFYDRVPHIRHLQLSTANEFLTCICCKTGLSRSELYIHKRKTLFRQVAELDADFVIFDLSSKMYETAIDLFLRTDFHVLVTNNEATSIQQSYNFLKYCFINELRNSFKQFFRANESYSLLAPRPVNHYSLFSILQQVKKESPEALIHFYSKFKKYSPSLIFNMVHNDNVETSKMALKLASRELLNIELNCVGSLKFIHQIRKALRAKNPLAEFEIIIQEWQQFGGIVKKLFEKQRPTKTYHGFRQVVNNGSLKHTKIFTDKSDNEIICSNQCPYWEKCHFRRGGYTCRVKYIGFLHKKAI